MLPPFFENRDFQLHQSKHAKPFLKQSHTPRAGWVVVTESPRGAYWIIKNQFGRRNLSAYDRSILALKLKPVIAAKAKENQIRKPVPKNSWEQTEQLPQTEKRKENRQRETNYQVAQKAGVSEDTIRKVERIEQQATPEIKAALKSGEISINAAYQDVKRAKRNRESRTAAQKFITKLQDKCRTSTEKILS